MWIHYICSLMLGLALQSTGNTYGDEMRGIGGHTDKMRGLSGYSQTLNYRNNGLSGDIVNHGEEVVGNVQSGTLNGQNNTECLIDHCSQCYNALLNQSCGDCNDIGDTTQRSKCLECLDTIRDTDNITGEVDWKCMYCDAAHTPSEDRNTCIYCGQSIPKCSECTSDTEIGEILCSHCDEGFTPSKTYKTCNACSVVKHCQKCTSPEDGCIQCTECQAGFSLSGNKCLDCGSITDHCGRCDTKAVCKACVTGFTMTGGKCQKITCGVPPPPPLRGSYTFTGMYYGDTVIYDCECGYDLHGSQTLVCDSTGEWGQPPCCNRKLCDITTTYQSFYGMRLTDDNVTQYLRNNLDPHVHELSLRSNQLTQISWITDFKELDTMWALLLFNNQIESFRWEDIPPSTEVFDLISNRLNKLPQLPKYTTCMRVAKFSVKNNHIESIESDQIPHTLVYLDLQKNHLTSLCDLSHTQLTRLDLYKNHLKNIETSQIPPSLERLDVSRNQLMTLCNLSHTKLRYLNLYNNQLENIKCKYIPNTLVKLDLSFNYLKSLCDISHTQVTHLNLDKNQLESIESDHLPRSLVELDISRNRLVSLGDLSQTKLRRLKANDNPLTAVRADHLPPSLLAISLFGTLLDCDSLTLNITYSCSDWLGDSSMPDKAFN